MKQLIVLISTIILGIAIAFMVMGFRTQARNLTDATNTQIQSIITEVGGETH